MGTCTLGISEHAQWCCVPKVTRPSSCQIISVNFSKKCGAAKTLQLLTVVKEG